MSIPKAVLYYNPKNVSSTAALLALEEKGYAKDELELKVVDTDKGENLAVTFLRLNPKGTLPTLVVPLAKTLSPEDDHRFKAITDTKSIVEFLDKSRSAISRTHTVSSAPAPTLTPATIAQSATAGAIIYLLHSDAADPQSLFYYSASTLSELRTAAPTILSFFIDRQKALKAYLESSKDQEPVVSEKTRSLWKERLTHAEELISVFSVADKEDSTLDAVQKATRAKYFQVAGEFWQKGLRKVLATLEKEMTGPFALGDQISIVDLHLGPWIARVAFLCGCSSSDGGDVVVAKIEGRIGDGFALPKNFQTIVAPDLSADPTLAATPGAKRSKLAAFWDEMIARPSWKGIFSQGLF